MKTIPCLDQVTIQIAEDKRDFDRLFPNGIENVLADEVEWHRQEPLVAFLHTDEEGKTECFKIAFRQGQGYMLWTLDADLDHGLSFVQIGRGSVDWVVHAKYPKKE